MLTQTLVGTGLVRSREMTPRPQNHDHGTYYSTMGAILYGNLNYRWSLTHLIQSPGQHTLRRDLHGYNPKEIRHCGFHRGVQRGVRWRWCMCDWGLCRSGRLDELHIRCLLVCSPRGSWDFQQQNGSGTGGQRELLNDPVRESFWTCMELSTVANFVQGSRPAQFG